MKAIDAMIVWEPATAETPAALGRMKASWQNPRAPEVRVFHNDDGDAHRRFDGLPCSLGACLLGWCEKDPLKDVFRAFLSVVSDGVPLAAVHREFLQIDEYAAVVDQGAYFGVEIPEREDA